MKPTYGLVPYTGCMMIETTLDHVGPMCNSTEGVARMLSVLAGPDPLDPRQRGVIPADYVRDYRSALERGVADMRIAVVREGFGQGPWHDLGLPAAEAVVDRSVMAAAHRLESLGAALDEVSIPMHLVGPYIFRGIIAEGAARFMIDENGAGSNWAGFYNTTLYEAFARGRRARPRSLPPGVVALALTGMYLQRYYDGRYYAKAQNVRDRLVAAYDEVLADYDLLVMPTIPFRAPPIPPPDCSIEELLSATGAMYANTCQADVTGHPAMSVPCGIAEGLPIGIWARLRVCRGIRVSRKRVLRVMRENNLLSPHRCRRRDAHRPPLRRRHRDRRLPGLRVAWRLEADVRRGRVLPVVKWMSAVRTWR